MDPPGIEPGASRMRSERDTITLRTQCREGSLFFTDKLSQSVSQGHNYLGVLNMGQSFFRFLF